MRIEAFADAHRLYISIVRYPNDMGWSAKLSIGSGEGHYASLVWIREKHAAPFCIDATAIDALNGLLALIAGTTLVIGDLHHREVSVPTDLTL
ncbi:MAG: hypothetical protein KBC02_00665 [Candidatus Pacebacteria bacterium]|nr:hypothetical protein [Candidatus Paceibacterota bacterium]